LDHWRLGVSEEDWKCSLEELEKLDVVLEHWVLDSFIHQFQEGFESQFGWHILPVDLSRHGVAPVWVEVVDLFGDLLDSSHPCCPALGEEASHHLEAEELDE
jgi:hypothetical protein